MGNNNNNDLSLVFKQINQQISEININQRNVVEKLDRISEKQSEQAETLYRNTATLEYHVKRTDLLEEKLKRLLDLIFKTQQDVEKVEKDFHKIEKDVFKIKFIADLIKPTKNKLKWIIVLAGLLGGTYTGIDVTSENSTIKEMIEYIYPGEK